MELTFSFLYKFFWGILLTLPTLAMLAIVIMILGIVVGKKEGWNKFDSIYWAFITALTVGYGDIRPVNRYSKVLALIISLIGIMLFGIIVAITVNTFGISLEEHLLNSK